MNAYISGFQVASEATSVPAHDRFPGLVHDLKLVFCFLQNKLGASRHLDAAMQRTILLGFAPAVLVDSYIPIAASHSVNKLETIPDFFIRLQAEHPHLLSGIVTYAHVLSGFSSLSWDEAETATTMIAFGEKKDIQPLLLKTVREPEAKFAMELTL